MGGKSSTQKTENAPPKWAVPLFSQSASEAKKLYESGAGGNVYQGQTAAGLGGTTEQGISWLKSAARAWDNPLYTNMLTAPTDQGYTDYSAMLKARSSAENNLGDYASGKYLKEGNPYYRDRLTNEIQDSNALVQSAFSGSGRYGSGANTNALAKNSQNMLLAGLENDYNRAQANQFAATGQIDAARQARLGANQAQRGLDQNQTSLRQNQVNQIANWNQGRDNAQQAIIGAGQLEDQARQQQLTADFTKWQSEDMQPWVRLGLLQSAAAGAAGNYGTNTQTATQPFNALQGVGALGSLFTKSDARAKTGIEPVGVKNGHVIYEWRYLGSSVKFRGVMAQDVIEIAPDAVTISADGFYAVNYGRLGFEMEAA
ncbi:MAG: tail fiber domain-containing protein [Pararhizobium sp.]